MLKIDDNARSSMWEDLVCGRQSEIDYLNGAICQLGRKCAQPTPVNDYIVILVNQIFDDPHASSLSGKRVLQQIAGFSRPSPAA